MSYHPPIEPDKVSNWPTLEGIMPDVEKCLTAPHTGTASALPVDAGKVCAGWSWLTLLPLSICWLSLFAVLSTDWSINSQYSYGWMVPLLAAAVFWQRWVSRPAAAPGHRGAVIAVPVTAILLLALPVRLIEEANPEWRFILWLHAGVVVSLSLLYLGYSGGRPWVKHFGFAVLFPLISVPLPVRMEQQLIQGLTRMVTTLTAELAQLTGIPAFQHGNVIEISAGVLGVEEACSGIHSLQSSLLVALFLGEHYRFSVAKRIALTASGVLIAILSNIGRTYALVRVAAHDGLRATDHLHDTVATVAMVVGLGLMFLLARSMRAKLTEEPASAGKREIESTPSLARPVPGWSGPVALLWLVCVGICVEMWYRSHESKAAPAARWSIEEPSAKNEFQRVEIPERARAILRYSKGHSMAWPDNSGNQWRLYYLRWDPGRNSAQLAKAHTPEICLSGTGGKLRESAGEHVFETGPLRLSFQQYVFDFGGQPLNVFYCLREDQRARGADNMQEDGSQRSRLASVLAGRRHLGQTVVELAVHGPVSAEEAREALALQLPRLIAQ